jgi:ABC-type uncharacterized transport system permease subunit
MFYSLLGRVVWYGLKLFLRRKYGPTYVPKSLIAGGTVAVAVGVIVAVLRARSGNA